MVAIAKIEGGGTASDMTSRSAVSSRQTPHLLPPLILLSFSNCLLNVMLTKTDCRTGA